MEAPYGLLLTGRLLEPLTAQRTSAAFEIYGIDGEEVIAWLYHRWSERPYEAEAMGWFKGFVAGQNGSIYWLKAHGVYVFIPDCGKVEDN